MPESKTIKPEAEEWFRAHRLEFVREKMVASKLYIPKNQWWIEIAERVIDNSDAHINVLCENPGYAEPRFHHLRIPVSFIAENRDDLDFREKIKKFSLHLSANHQTLFRDERGQGNIDFSRFQYPPTGGANKHANNTTPASGANARVFVFIDLENVPKEYTSDILTWLAEQAKFKVEGAAFTAKREPGAYKTWKRLFQMHSIEVKRALPTGKDAADAKLIVELTRTMPRLKNGDHICIIGSDAIYNQAVAVALEKGIRVLHFAKSKPKWDPKDSNYRFFLIDAPEKWRLPHQ